MTFVAHIGLDHLVVVLPAVLIMLLAASAMTNRRGQRKTSHGLRQSATRRRAF